MMDNDHSTSDVLLPPRKRLLAGFKKQNSHAHPDALHPPLLVSPPSSSPPSSPCHHLSNQFQTRLKTLLSSHLDNRNLSPDEIVRVSKSAAISAVKSAEAARAVAQDKAAIAAKAVASAKAALELVAALSDSNERSHNKNGKLKKHVPVKLLYKKHQPVQKFGTDEELAHSLHRTINSSPRISNHKHKRRKGFPPYDNSRVPKGTGTLVLGEAPSASKTNNAGSSSAKEKFHDDAYSPCKKRGRVKLKKLPLSICSFRDQVNPKEGFARSSSTDEMMMSIEDYTPVEMAGAQDMQLQ